MLPLKSLPAESGVTPLLLGSLISSFLPCASAREGGVDAPQSAASAVCVRARKKMRNPDLDLSLRLSAAELFSCSGLSVSASAEGAPPPQRVSPHSSLSSAHQPRPLTVNLPPTTQGSGTSHFPSIVLSSCRPLWKSTSSLLFIDTQSLPT